MKRLTEELLGGALLLDDFNETRSELLDGRDVAGKHTHITRFSRDVDLGPV